MAPCMPAPSTACVSESIPAATPLTAIDAGDDILFVDSQVQALRIVFHGHDVSGPQRACGLGAGLLPVLLDQIGADFLTHGAFRKISIAGLGAGAAARRRRTD